MRNIVETEKPYGAVVQFGGQTAIGLAKALSDMGVRILGSDQASVDAAEDRERFDDILSEHGIRRPPGHTVFTSDEAVAAAEDLGYPVLIRPSYVLGGAGMRIATGAEDVRAFCDQVTEIAQEHPILIDKYIRGTEVEVDAIYDGTDILVPGIMEHIERAGIHSGDSISVYPTRSVSPVARETLLRYTRLLAQSLRVVGMINIQFIAVGDEVFIIEANPRASRTVPYISKVTGIPIIDVATRVICGESIRAQGYAPGLQREVSYSCVKMPVFSFEKIHNADIALGPEMKSTGECLGIAPTFHEALAKAFLGAGIRLPRYKNIVISVREEDKTEIVPIARRFEALGYRIFATRGTSAALTQAGIRNYPVRKLEQESPNIMDLVLGHELDLIIDTPGLGAERSRDGLMIRQTAIETGVHVLTALDTAEALVNSLEHTGGEESLTELSEIH